VLFERKKLAEILQETPELMKHGNWKCLNIDNRVAWPTTPQQFEFEGHAIWVIPATTDHYPGLAINRPSDLPEDECWAMLHRALSMLAWQQNAGVVVLYRSGGSIPQMMRMNEKPVAFVRASFDLTELPQPTTGRAKLALALMREARSLNHPAFAFLSFYKVIETAIPNGKERANWIDANIENLGARGKEAVEELKPTVSGNLGAHLRESGRHAIAHARLHSVINPDDPRDATRLRNELPIMEALAERAIEERLGVQTTHTILREHLYELRGWKDLVGTTIVTKVSAGESIEGTVDLPLLNIRLRRSKPFAPLEAMQPAYAAPVNKTLELVYKSSDSLVSMQFYLDFAHERLRFDPYQGLQAIDDGSVSALRNAKALSEFLWAYFGNGELQMWNADTGELIGHCDAFIPVNVMLNIEGHDAELAQWDRLIAEREAALLGDKNDNAEGR
jgi:hypothetical protein